MRALVQADPEPEVARVHVEGALGRDDVRRDQGEPTPLRRTVVEVLRRHEDLVLPEHLAGEEGEYGADFGSGDPRPDRAEHPVARAAATLLRQPVEQRTEDEPEPLDIAGDPTGPVDHSRWPRFHISAQAGVGLDMGLGFGRQLAQLADDGGGFVVGDARARWHESARGRLGEVPVDEEVTAHLPTVRRTRIAPSTLISSSTTATAPISAGAPVAASSGCFAAGCRLG